MAKVFDRPVFAIILVFCVGVLTTVNSGRTISLPRYVDCERQCPYYFFPICASNGNATENRMFVNICEMQAWNCDAKRKYRRTRNTACKDYGEYADELWLSSHKPLKITNEVTNIGPQNQQPLPS